MAETIPYQSQCNMANPEEHFLWALAQIPVGPTNMMSVQLQTVRLMSKHLHELGFRHHPGLQTKKLQPPIRGQKSSLNCLAQWVPLDTKDPKPLAPIDVRGMTAAEREVVKNELEAVGHIKKPAPDVGPTAAVTSADFLLRPFVKRATTADELGK